MSAGLTFDLAVYGKVATEYCGNFSMRCWTKSRLWLDIPSQRTYLGGDGNIDEAVRVVPDVVLEEMAEEECERRRVTIPRRPATERVTDFQEVELCFTEEAALAEAARCLRCDLEEYEE